MTDPQHASKSTGRRTRRLALRRHAQRTHFHFYSHRSNWTFLQNVAASPVNWRAEHWILGAVALLLTALTGIVIPTWANATRHVPDPTPYTTIRLDLPQLPPGAEADPGIGAYGLSGDTEPDWHIVRVQAGQSLSDIFNAQGLGADVLQRALDSQDDASALRSIRPGQQFAFALDKSGALTAMRFDRDAATEVTLHFTPDHVTQSVHARDLEHRVQVAHGVVRGSLFDAGEKAGLSDNMVLRLAKAFAYDIDFARDLHAGDSFSVVYNQVYREGEHLKDGDILAATFVNKGKRFTAIRYTNAQGETMFYDETGRPLRTSFLRTPVAFTRISSGFSSARLHPLLGYTRAHQGVDYAAPTGTPIHAAGDGKIIFRGWQHGYGNVVILQNGPHFRTLYAHMSRFASEKVGQHVGQGDTIGFVGMTGLATGPHLHYGFSVDGVFRNPLTVTMPKAEPLPPTQLAQFKRKSAPVLAELKTINDIRLARADD